MCLSAFRSGLELSAVAYLRHMGRIRGLSSAAAASRASGLMDRLELSGGETSLRQLSKGNAQRVGLIQALLIPPDLLILDEPATGLDELGHGVLIEIVDEVARDGGAVVLGSPLHAELPAGAVVVRLDGGRLTPVQRGSSTPTVDGSLRIVLRRGRNSLPLPTSWSELNAAEQTGMDYSATVPAGISDRLLSAALQGGWSVVSVVPVGPDSGSPAPSPDEPGRPAGGVGSP